MQNVESLSQLSPKLFSDIKSIYASFPDLGHREFQISNEGKIWRFSEAKVTGDWGNFLSSAQSHDKASVLETNRDLKT